MINYGVGINDSRSETFKIGENNSKENQQSKTIKKIKIYMNDKCDIYKNGKLIFSGENQELNKGKTVKSTPSDEVNNQLVKKR